LSFDRAHAATLAALSRLYGRTNSWESLLAICAGEAEVARDLSEHIELDLLVGLPGCLCICHVFCLGD